MIRHLFALLLLPALLLLCLPLAAQKKAVLDLGQFTPGGGNIIRLDSVWEFYYNRLYSPQDFKTKNIDPDLLVKPGSWNDLVVQGKKCGSYGYATYRITLVNLPAQDLLLDVYSLQTAYRIFVNDSLAAVVGQPGTSAQATQPMNKDVQVVIPAGLRRAEIIIQVANFHHRKGGFVNPPELGNITDILHRHLMFYVLDALESSALFIIGLFLFALFIFRRKDLSVLYFALFCITLSFRPVISVNYLVATLLPGINWTLMLKLEYLGVLFPCLFMTLFIRKRFPRQLPRWIVRGLSVIFLVKIIVTVFFPVPVFSWLVVPLLVLIPLGIFILTITILRAVIAREDGARYAGMGVTILFVSLMLKVLSYAGLIPTMHVLITMLDIGFIFMMSLILGSRFSQQFVKVEALQKRTEQQHQEIEQKKAIVEEKNKEITDSIHYAERLQRALLANKKLLDAHLHDYFIYFNPKEAVSGDFYWAAQLNNGNFALVVADSTGHGVPGAIMSIMNMNSLRESVKEGLCAADQILNHTRQTIIETLANDGSAEGGKDGMDAALLIFDAGKTKAEFALANNPLWLVRNNTINEYLPDKMPVGKHDKQNIPFTRNMVDLQKGDILYVFTDGYADQFGGERGKKFKYAQLGELLLKISALPLQEQHDVLKKRFEEWKGDLEQVDDVCIIGIRI